MFEQKALMFLYCVSPVHMGAGQALGVVDNPIQRERHTGHPLFAGSGIKGALRDQFLAAQLEANGNDRDAAKRLTNQIFGPEAEASDHAGAVAFTDAQVVAFPVRSLRESFVYATCPTALARLKRAAELAGLAVGWSVPAPSNDDVCVAQANSGLTVKAKLDGREVDTIILESFQFTVSLDSSAKEQLGKVASWLAEQAIPADQSYAHFRSKLGKHLVVLSDTRFDYFVNNATTVEPHVRISDESGTADDGGLFYTENVPPEAIFHSLVMTSRQRVKRGEGSDKESSTKPKNAKEILALLRNALHEKVVQIGGDATSGRGLVVARIVE